MNKELYKKLEVYEDIFKKAIESKFIRTISSYHSSQLNLFYKEEFGTDSRIKGGCGACVLKDVTRLANAYFDFQKKNKETSVVEFTTQGSTIDNVSLEVGETVEDVVKRTEKVEEEAVPVNEENKEKKKKGRPKKNA